MVSAPKSGCYLGVYHDAATIESAMGHLSAIHHRFWNDISDPGTWPAAADVADAAAGVIPMITAQHPDIPGLVAGSYDTGIRAKADKVKTFGKPILIRFDHEMNTTSMPWSTDPAAYVTAWRRLVGIFRDAGATNASFVWCPNNGTSSAYKAKGWNFLTWYPGDDVVDWVGIDGYNWGNGKSWSTWETFAKVFGGYDPIYATFAGRKPIMLGEVATHNTPGDPAAWVRDLGAQLKGPYSGIRAVVWFNTIDQAMTWPLSPPDAKLAEWVTLARDPFFQASLANPDPVPVPPPAASIALTVTQSHSGRMGRFNGWLLSVDTSAVVPALSIRIRSEGGTIVRHLLTNFVPKTTHVTCTWKLRDDAGAPVPPGRYYADATAGTATASAAVPV